MSDTIPRSGQYCGLVKVRTADGAFTIGALFATNGPNADMGPNDWETGAYTLDDVTKAIENGDQHPSLPRARADLEEAARKLKENSRHMESIADYPHGRVEHCAVPTSYAPQRPPAKAATTAHLPAS